MSEVNYIVLGDDITLNDDSIAARKRFSEWTKIKLKSFESKSFGTINNKGNN